MSETRESRESPQVRLRETLQNNEVLLSRTTPAGARQISIRGLAERIRKWLSKKSRRTNDTEFRLASLGAVLCSGVMRERGSGLELPERKADGAVAAAYTVRRPWYRGYVASGSRSDRLRYFHFDTASSLQTFMATDVSVVSWRPPRTLLSPAGNVDEGEQAP
ncbi:hypothetical protein SKAU_G00143100 [Synaphobranchus kaupii]|uniref:Uncharacterized protein n=1 Tax=Synaphobranchus kaupii TaxID=118154 RepID=A0A9Q1J3H8_SYNKA|nr:hypothetical protein SKAU_G00143100 [Synaphobranchus kaupii]